MFHPFFKMGPPRARVSVPPNAPATALRNKGAAELIDVHTLIVPCDSVNTKPRPKNIEADFALAKLRRAIKDTFQDEQNRTEGLPLISDPTQLDRASDPGGWLRTPENDAPRNV